MAKIFVFLHVLAQITENHHQEAKTGFFTIFRRYGDLGRYVWQKKFFEVITSLSKVRVRVFERKPSADEHAIDLA